MNRDLSLLAAWFQILYSAIFGAVLPSLVVALVCFGIHLLCWSAA